MQENNILQENSDFRDFNAQEGTDAEGIFIVSPHLLLFKNVYTAVLRVVLFCQAQLQLQLQLQLELRLALIPISPATPPKKYLNAI